MDMLNLYDRALSLESKSLRKVYSSRTHADLVHVSRKLPFLQFLQNYTNELTRIHAPLRSHLGIILSLHV